MACLALGIVRAENPAADDPVKNSKSCSREHDLECDKRQIFKHGFVSGLE